MQTATFCFSPPTEYVLLHFCVGFNGNGVDNPVASQLHYRIFVSSRIAKEILLVLNVLALNSWTAPKIS